jgi:hypothetical protein
MTDGTSPEFDLKLILYAASGCLRSFLSDIPLAGLRSLRQKISSKVKCFGSRLAWDSFAAAPHESTVDW